MPGTLEEKVQEIQEWLESISADLPKESYEINEFTVNYLYQLSQLNKRKDAHLQIMAKDNIDKAEEFSAEDERMKKELEYLGIVENAFNSATTERISELVDLANELSLSNPTMENYLVTLSEHTLEELDLKDSLESCESELQELNLKLKRLELEMGKLNVDDGIITARNSEVDQHVEIEAAKAQAQFYVESTKEFKRLLSASGVKKEYTHENLQNMSEKVTSLALEVEKTKKRVAAFKELPPSIPLAKEQIKQIKIEIQAIEEEFPELTCGVML